jgi:hypothetical protein
MTALVIKLPQIALERNPGATGPFYRFRGKYDSLELPGEVAEWPKALHPASGRGELLTRKMAFVYIIRDKLSEKWGRIKEVGRSNK